MSEGYRGALEVPALWRDVLRAYSHHWHLLVPLALVVLLPQALADAAFADIEIHRVHTFTDVARLASVPLAVAINLGGEALYAGIVAAIVLRWRAGERAFDLIAVARTVPYRRLIAIDLALSVVTAIGLALLLIPGLIFYTYVGIAPALIKLKRLSIRDSVAKSIELVRGNFWRALLFTAAVVLATDSLSTLLESPVHGLTGEIAFNLAIEAVLEPFQGLATVLLAIALLELHGERPQG